MPLMLAAAKGHDDVVRRLLFLGADVNLRDYRGATAVHLTCKKGHVATLRLLLNAGAAIDLHDR